MIRDVFVNFMQVTWSSDSSQVALFARGSKQIEFAFDYNSRREIPFELIRKEVAAQIRRQYHLAPDDNPFECERCVEEFVKENPSSVSQ